MRFPSLARFGPKHRSKFVSKRWARRTHRPAHSPAHLRVRHLRLLPGEPHDLAPRHLVPPVSHSRADARGAATGTATTCDRRTPAHSRSHSGTMAVDRLSLE